MKRIFNFILLMVICLFSNPEKIHAQLSTQLKDVQTVWYVAADSSCLKSGDIKKLNEKDADRFFQLLFNSLSNGKFSAYENYPNKKLTSTEILTTLTPWDSTYTAEDPYNPGVFVTAPVRNETHAQDIPYIIFHEEIWLDSTTGRFERKVSYITVYRYFSTQKTGIVGIRKLFDVKVN
ncbi:MAG TPA: hypothetical protein VFF27_13090 [Bacteroidia bacterium]|nr:hypothetical protein [Bacteroidia bacterium]